MTERDLGSFEMLWDCQNCGTTKLLGVSHRFCPNCGGPQNPKWRYFPADEDKVATKDHVFTGADIVCPACDVPNSKAAQHCVACGSDLVKGKEAAIRKEQAVGQGDKFADDSAKIAVREHKEARLEREAQVSAPPPKKPASKAWLWGGIAAAVILLIGVVIFWKREAAVTVVSHTWARQIDIERFGPRSESAWCDSTPHDARMITHHQEVRSHKKVADGETCHDKRVDRGDGSFKQVRKCETKYRDEPVYDDKCNFVVDRWQTHHTLKESGASLAQAPHWPAVTLTRTGNCMGCEREGSRTESYTLHFTDAKKKALSCTVSQDRWQKIADNSQWKAKVGVITGNIDCDTLR